MAVRTNRGHPPRVIRTIVRAPPHVVWLEVQLPRPGFERRRRTAVLTDAIGTAQYIEANCATPGVDVLEPDLSARARRHDRKRPPTQLGKGNLLRRTSAPRRLVSEIWRLSRLTLSLNREFEHDHSSQIASSVSTRFLVMPDVSRLAEECHSTR